MPSSPTVFPENSKPRSNAIVAMLPLHALAIVGAAVFATRLELGAYPLLIALASPLLHLVTRRE